MNRRVQCLQFSQGVANFVYMSETECMLGNVNVVVTFTSGANNSDAAYLVVCRREIQCERKDYEDFNRYLHYRAVPYLRRTKMCVDEMWRFSDVTVLKYSDESFAVPVDLTIRDDAVARFKYAFSDELRAMMHRG